MQAETPIPHAPADATSASDDAIHQREWKDFAAPGYQDLAGVLQKAHDQAAHGKGRHRHANNKPILEQPIMQIGRMVGVGGHAYQICKKAQEATGMVARADYAHAEAELLGVINYAAAMILLINEIGMNAPAGSAERT